ncbi:hypothetical protein M422DRAFT_783339 [Sphaerobolus stellatus SS14]|uniref:Cation-transporting P-type ATPase N-terminal domain-containing protein n=1 Tax=Sphaerobolus stellatus (strain SS14) TaxID=990650 RepID=A0A0C9V5H3_SPHS4|nr:hypothetical protein M422DRAFT_783339 [Sphaerobolus stellatus SS14]
MRSFCQLHPPTAFVVRNGESAAIPSKDVVHGNVVPSDVREVASENPPSMKPAKLAYVLFRFTIILIIIVFAVAHFHVTNEVILYAILTAIAIIPEYLIALFTLIVNLGGVTDQRPEPPGSVSKPDGSRLDVKAIPDGVAQAVQCSSLCNGTNGLSILLPPPGVHTSVRLLIVGEGTEAAALALALAVPAEIVKRMTTVMTAGGSVMGMAGRTGVGTVTKEGRTKARVVAVVAEALPVRSEAAGVPLDAVAGVLRGEGGVGLGARAGIGREGRSGIKGEEMVAPDE